MKKYRLLVIALVFVFTVSLLAGCGGQQGGAEPAPAPDPAAPTTPSTPANTDDGKVYNLNVSMTIPEELGPGVLEMVKNCEERSNGRLQFTIYWFNSLINITELPKGYQDGIADMGNIPLNTYSDQMPLNSIIANQPFLGYANKQQTWDIVNQIHEEFPEMNQEFLDLGMTPVAFYPLAPYYLHLVTDKEVRLPSDLKGKKILTSKLELSEFLTNNSAAPINQPITEFFNSLEKGVADGVWEHWGILRGMSLIELIHQHIYFGETGSHVDFNAYIIRTETLNALPEDLREILLEEWGKAAAAEAVTQQTRADGAKQASTEQGDLIVELTPDELTQWQKALQPINTTRIEEIAKKKPVATQISDRIAELIK